MTRRFLCLSLLLLPLSLRAGESLEPIILSGFEPFGGRKVNASYQLATALAEANEDRDLTLLEVPVVWGAPEKTLAAQEKKDWKLWIAFGEGKNGALWIETVADNQRGKGRDNLKEQAAEPQILEDAEAQLQSDFPTQALIAELESRGVPARSSTEAGNYLCEEMLFNLLHARADESDRIVLFIHTPVMGGKVVLPDGTETTMKPAVMKRWGKEIIAAVERVVENSR